MNAHQATKGDVGQACDDGAASGGAVALPAASRSSAISSSSWRTTPKPPSTPLSRSRSAWSTCSTRAERLRLAITLRSVPGSAGGTASVTFALDRSKKSTGAVFFVLHAAM
jgi:hypothetical protein